MSPEFSGFPVERAPQHDLMVPDSCFAGEDHSRTETSRLATVPEGRPLTSEPTPQVLPLKLIYNVATFRRPQELPLVRFEVSAQRGEGMRGKREPAENIC